MATISNGSAVTTPRLRREKEYGLYTEQQVADKYGIPKKQKDWKNESKRIITEKFSCSGQKLKGFAHGIFPISKWLPKYKLRDNLLGDVIAGLTVGVVHLPQGMAYGILASLTAVSGLYVSFFPVLVYMLFGTSRHMSIGTFAVISLMIAQVINDKVPPCPETQSAVDSTTAVPFTTDQSTVPVTDECQANYEKRKVEVAIALAIANGIIQIAMSVLRLGIVTTYLSSHLVSGFTCGCAFHVLTSQIQKLIGISVPRISGPLSLVYTYIELFSNITTINWATVIVSTCCIIFLVIGKEINLRFHDRLPIPLPWELGVIVFATIASSFGEFNEKYNVEIVGNIPTGIETTVPAASDIGLVIADAIPIAIVAFAVEISLCQIFATRFSYKVDADQELLAMGFANIVGSFFSCYPCAPSLSRCVIWVEAGAKTQLTGLFSSALILIILLWIGPLFESLPQAALASIIVVNLKGMLKQFEKIPGLWRINKLDAITWLVTWTAVVLLGVSLGLGVAVIFEILTVVIKTQLATGSVLRKIDRDSEYRDVKKYRTMCGHSNVIVFRFPGPIYFANKENFKTQISDALGFDPAIATKKSMSKRESSNVENHTELVVKNHGFDETEQQSVNKEVMLPDEHPIDDNQKSGAFAFPEAETLAMPEEDTVTHLIVDMGSCSFLDNDGAQTIKALHKSLGEVDIKLLLADCYSDVRKALEVACDERRPPFFTTVSRAMDFATGEIELDLDKMGLVVKDNSDDSETRL